MVVDSLAFEKPMLRLSSQLRDITKWTGIGNNIFILFASVLFATSGKNFVRFQIALGMLQGQEPA